MVCQTLNIQLEFIIDYNLYKLKMNVKENIYVLNDIFLFIIFFILNRNILH